MEDAFAADIAVRAQGVDRSVQCEASGAAAFPLQRIRPGVIVDRARARQSRRRSARSLCSCTSCPRRAG